MRGITSSGGVARIGDQSSFVRSSVEDESRGDRLDLVSCFDTAERELRCHSHAFAFGEKPRAKPDEGRRPERIPQPHREVVRCAPAPRLTARRT